MADSPSRIAAAAPSGRRDRILTGPLTVFLLAVAGVLAMALVLHLQRPSAAAAVLQLADGDLDGSEREQALQILVEQGAKATTPHDRWASLLAAVALSDAPAYQRLITGYGGDPRTFELPTADGRRFLGLGDDRIANLAAAMWAEAEGDLDGARRRYRQLATECELAPNALAAQLAAAALQRLH